MKYTEELKLPIYDNPNEDLFKIQEWNNGNLNIENGIKKINSQLDDITHLNVKEVSIKKFNKAINSDISDVFALLPEDCKLVLDGTYKISSPIILKNKSLRGGKLLYIGEDNKDIITLHQNSEVSNIEIEVVSQTFCGNMLLIDYTENQAQQIFEKYYVDNIVLKNNATSCITGSTAIRIIYDKYKVICYKDITNVKFFGIIDYGIYIEPHLRNEIDNPVYNTCSFKNISFWRANCPLCTVPKMETGDISKCKGEIVLNLDNFSNQVGSFVNKPFMDLVNTKIEGNMVIPWDYYGSNIPLNGIYKTLNSEIFLTKIYYDDGTGNVNYSYKKQSTGECYTNLNKFKTTDINNDLPLREPNGIGWSIDNIKVVTFTPQVEYNPYSLKYIGFEIQPSNTRSPQNETWQVGIDVNGEIKLRKYNSTTKAWNKPFNIYSDAKPVISYYAKRTSGASVGAMKFDTTIKKPVWWDGSQWILSDGTKAFDVDA